MIDPDFLGKVATEVEGIRLGDKRRDARYALCMSRLSASPSKSFPTAMDNAELQGLYALLGHPRVSPSLLLQPHWDATSRRLASSPGLLYAIHDSTDFTFKVDGDRSAFFAHFSLAVASDRTPLGVLNFRAGRGRAKAEKGSARWKKAVDQVNARFSAQRARLLHLMDREADDYALYAHLVASQSRFVIRAFRDRFVLAQLLGETKLCTALEHAQLKAARTVKLEARGSDRPPRDRQLHPPREERLTTLSIASTQVLVKRPRNASKELPAQLALSVVRVWEEHPPEGEKAVEWVLLTSEPVGTEEEVLAVVDAYRARWVVEEYFKALKTGCGYERRQVEGVRSRLNALAMLSVIAWQLLLMRALSREEEQRPAEAVFTEAQLKVMRHEAKRMRNYVLPEQATVREALLAVAAVGGHLKRNGWPGWQVIGRGLETVFTMTQGYLLAKQGM